jgi:hypothetical protein
MFSFKVAYPFRSRKIIRFYLLNDKTRIVKERKKKKTDCTFLKKKVSKSQYQNQEFVKLVGLEALLAYLGS